MLLLGFLLLIIFTCTLLCAFVLPFSIWSVGIILVSALGLYGSLCLICREDRPTY